MSYQCIIAWTVSVGLLSAFLLHAYIPVNLQPGSFLQGRSAFPCCLPHKRKLVGRTASCCLMIQKIQAKLLEVGQRIHVDSHILFTSIWGTWPLGRFWVEEIFHEKNNLFNGVQWSVTTNGCCKTMVNHKPLRIHGILTCVDPLNINHSWIGKYTKPSSHGKPSWLEWTLISVGKCSFLTVKCLGMLFSWTLAIQ